MKTSDFDYNLPQERIAQTPLEPRDSSRLMVLHRASGDLQHTHFHQLGRFLRPGDLLVLNHTRVIPARLYAVKADTGGKVEVLLLSKRGDQTWEALVGGKRVNKGKRLRLENGIDAEVIEELGGARRLVRFEQPAEDFLAEIGNMPLPPYIHERLEDPERYQTVYAQQSGSAAAPTAGLHFTPRLLSELTEEGIRQATLTLHVGLDTFAPVTEDDPQEHRIHTEWCSLPPQTAQVINETKKQGGRIIAVGTTSVRLLESAARNAGAGEVVAPFEGPTDLFILPGFEFKAVDAMVTNFHLPRSSLLMLVSAFAGRRHMLDAYRTAIDMEYRFFSFGDAMLLI